MLCFVFFLLRFAVLFSCVCSRFCFPYCFIFSYVFVLFSFYVSFDFSLFIKPTSIWRPLSPESMHPVTVHEHWPISQCARISKRFSDTKQAATAVADFKHQLSLINGVTIGEVANLPKPKQITSWIVLPFTYVLGNSRISSVVSRLNIPNSLSSVFGRIRISWKLANKRLMHMLRLKRRFEF